MKKDLVISVYYEEDEKEFESLLDQIEALDHIISDCNFGSSVYGDSLYELQDQLFNKLKKFINKNEIQVTKINDVERISGK